MQTSIRIPCPFTQLVEAIARVQYFCGAGVIQDRNVSLKVQQANGVLLSLLEKYHRNGLQTISEAKEKHPEFVSSWHLLIIVGRVSTEKVAVARLAASPRFIRVFRPAVAFAKGRFK